MKGFGKLSPDDKLSASLIPMLYDRPHKVLAILRAASNGTKEEENFDVKVKERMDMGNFLEESIMHLIAERLDIQLNYPVTEVMSIEIGMGADRKPWDVYASLDGMYYATKAKVITPADRSIYTPDNKPITLLGPVPIEVKNMQFKPYDSIECMTVDHGRGYLQLQLQMLIAEAKFGIVGCLFNGNDLRVFVVKTDKKIQAAIKEKALTLYQHLEDGTEYDPHDVDSMASKYPDIIQDQIDLPKETIDEVEQYESYVMQIKELTAKKEASQMKMIDALGDAEAGIITHDAGMVKLTRPTRNYKEQPAKYVEAKPARSMRAKTVTIKRLMESY